MKNITRKLTLEGIRNSKEYQRGLESERSLVRLGALIYSSRNSLNLTQEDLAKRIGTTQKVISNIENADVNIGFDLLVRLAGALHFSQYEYAKVFNFEISYRILYMPNVIQENRMMITSTELSENFTWSVSAK